MKIKAPYILCFVFVSFIWCQCDDGYTEYENECYYNEDLNTLTMLIYLNDIEFDVFYDIGITLWENGHINTLMLEGLSIHEIPSNTRERTPRRKQTFSRMFLHSKIFTVPRL